MRAQIQTTRASKQASQARNKQFSPLGKKRKRAREEGTVEEKERSEMQGSTEKKKQGWERPGRQKKRDTVGVRERESPKLRKLAENRKNPSPTGARASRGA